MDGPVSSPIHQAQAQARPGPNGDDPQENIELGTCENASSTSKNNSSSNNTTNVFVKRERPTRACTARPAKYVDPPVIERRRAPRKEKVEKWVVKEIHEDEEEEEENDEKDGKEMCSKVVTSLVNVPTQEQMPRWNLRSMWELASILNFFHIFKPLLNITVEFSAEELETALLTANGTLGEVHVPLLKAIPPVTRMAYGRDTWISVLCRKLRDWWHWVAEGELPIVASHGAEIEAYRNLDPGVRVVILKALCDIRVEQDDIRSYIDDSLKHGIQLLSAFRKERIGGDSRGISYWYEEDEIIGHRLYREIRKVEKKVEVKKGKTRGSRVMPSTSYEWETVATNLDEFVDVSEKLFLSKNRTEASLGKKLENIMIPEIEKVHKRKEKLLKKQQREALLLDSFVSMDGLATGRSLRDRKPVTYTFDDFDRSINEAIKIIKRKQPSPEPAVRREGAKSEPSANGRWNGPSHASLRVSFSPPSPINFDEMNEEHYLEQLDRSNRRRQRPQRYSEEFVEALSENEEDFESDDEIVGEVVYDDEYLKRKQQKKKLTSSSEGEGDEEYHWSDENGEDEVEEEEEEGDSLSMSDDSDQPRHRFKRSEGRTRRGATRLRSVDAFDSGLRRSKRATRNRINYRQYEVSESENESAGQETLDASERHSDGTENADYSMESQESEGNDEEQGTGFEPPPTMDVVKDENNQSLTKPESSSQDDDDDDGIGNRRFLDLNQLAPDSGFEDGPSALVKDDYVKGE